MTRPVRARVTGTILTVVTALALVASTVGFGIPAPVHGAVGSSPPTVGLLAATPRLDVTRFEGEPIFLDLGVYAASVGGPFELHVRRHGRRYGVQQIVRDDAGTLRVARDLGDRAVRRLADGLSRFLHAEIRTTGGDLVHEEVLPFCPSGWLQARIDDTGPANATYPMDCGASRQMAATVWGIDQGWAVPVTIALRQELDLPDGAYDVTVTIAPAWIDVLGVRAGTDRVTVRIVVTTEDAPPWCPVEDPCEDHLVDLAGPERPGGGHHHHDIGSGAVQGWSGLPDLVALPAFAAEITHDGESGRDHLNFAATVWNAGPGPLVVEGFRRPGTDFMDATQHLRGDGRPASTVRVGTFEYDRQAGHEHWHFTDFARYRLLADDDRLVVRSQKEAFCLAPTDAIDLTLPGATWRPRALGLDSSCGWVTSIWIRQILEAGWGDTYNQTLPGQSFDVTDLPNGIYTIEVTTNPDQRLHEHTTDNNTALRRVVLGGQPGERTATMR